MSAGPSCAWPPEPRFMLSPDYAVYDADGLTRDAGYRYCRRRGVGWVDAGPLRPVDSVAELVRESVYWMRRSYVLPPRLEGELSRYLDDGVEPGYCVRAALEDSLTRALGAADEYAAPVLPAVAHYVFQKLPAAAWGSRAAVDAWVRRGGLRGRAGGTPT